MTDLERMADNLVQYVFDRDCRIDIGRFSDKSYYMSIQTNAVGHWLWQILSVTENSGVSPYFSFRPVVHINNIDEFSLRNIKTFQKYWLNYIEICNYINLLKIPKVLLENGMLVEAIKKAYKVRHKCLII